MEIQLDDASGLPEAMKGFVSDRDGKQVLDLAKAAADLDGWKAKTQTATGESIERRKALKAWEALGASPDEVQAKLAKGADPAIIEAMRADYATKEAASAARFKALAASNTLSALKVELARVGVIPEGIDLLARDGSAQIAYDDDGEYRIVGEDGKPMIGGGQNGGATLADLAKAIAAKFPSLSADGGLGGGGKPPGAGGGDRKATGDLGGNKAARIAALKQRFPDLPSG